MSIAATLALAGAPKATLADCANPTGPKPAGVILYNTDHRIMQYCDGADWIAMGGGPQTGSGCPKAIGADGVEGEILYNIDHRVMQYCNSFEWVAMGPFSGGASAHWKFDETSGTTAADSAGSNDGTLIGFPADPWYETDGMIGGTLLFDGTDDRVTHNYALNKTAGSISHWLIPGTVRDMVAVYEANCTSSSCDGGGTSANVLEIQTGTWNDGGGVKWHFMYQDGTNAAQVNLFSSTAPVVGAWVHLAATWDTAGQAKLYINGAEVASDAMTAYTFAGNTPSVRQLGRVGNGTATRHWSGLIDDLRIYDRALTAAEVASLYQAVPAATRDDMGTNLSGSWKWVHGVLGPDGKIYGIPNNAGNILIIDSAAGTATLSAMGANLSGTAKWAGGTLGPDGKIYGIPHDSTDILIIDPAAGTATRSNMGASLSGSAKWEGGVLGPDGKIYAIPYDATDILIIDPVAGTAVRDDMGADLTGTGKWIGGVLAPDGKIYAIPYDATDILIIDPAAGTATLSNMGADLSGSGKWHGGALGADGKIYGLPRNPTGFLIIDPAAGTATLSNMGADLAGGGDWIGGVTGSDGKIYGMPFGATDALIIDPAAGTATRSAMGADLSGSAKWYGGVLGPDGKIYGMPFSSTDILIIAGLSCGNPAHPEGTLLYNSSSKVMQYCDGANWVAIGKGVAEAFSFTDQEDVALSTVIESNTINIAGISGSVSVSISGDGSPQFRINGGSWTTSGSIAAGDTLQLRLTSSASGSTTNRATVTVGIQSDQWDVTTNAVGVSVGGFLWYLSDPSESCTDVCSTHGGYDAATASYAGSGGSNANCQSVMDALGAAGSSVTPFDCSGGGIPGLGCCEGGGTRVRCTAPATTEGASYDDTVRACACNN